MIRLCSRFARVNAAAVSADTVKRSAIDDVIFDAIGFDRLERAVADVQCHLNALDATRRERVQRPAVKCRPAVGAATDPRSRA